MKRIFRQALLLLLFWFGIFFFNRIIFFCCETLLLNDVPFSIIAQSFYRGLRLDLSTSGYLCVIPLLLLFFYYVLQKKVVLRLMDFFSCMMIIVYNLISFGEVCLYREWKAKLSMQALEHFAHPEEVFKSASAGLTILFFSLVIVFSWLYIKIYRKSISLIPQHKIPAERTPGRHVFIKASFMLFAITAFSVISIRGGLQAIPIQSSDAYFCTIPIANDAAVNPFWNLVYSIMQYEGNLKENPYKDFPQEEADRIVRELYKVSKDTTVNILRSEKPNIVFILLESWSAYTVKSFGGDDFAPFTDSLSREGIRFTKLYPAGYVSDQGIPAVLSGYPCTSRIAIINDNSKSLPLPCINEDLKKHGYESGFAFGGDLNYGNIRSYLFNKKFDVIKEEKDFNSGIARGKLGIQDKEMAKEYIKMLNEARTPFVYSWFTLSSHMPYDFPGEKKPLVKTENEYINSVKYSDEALRQFFMDAKTQPWYPNTLFVLVADHSHASHKEFSVYDPEYHRIPLVLFGEVIDSAFRGKEISRVYSQLDITYSILKQMKLHGESRQYTWSKDMFNPYSRSFAFYCSYSGSGFVTDEGYIGYQHGLNELIFNSLADKRSKADTLTMFSKAFQQSVYEDYRLK
ncbi:MAG TPA: LTA synthase family protein [Bacteroidia bacterium]